MDPGGGRARPPRRRVDGVLLLDKPAGLSSNAALQRAKRAFAAHKAGHTGTLDPLATGLLPLCFGDATKFAQAVLDAPKEYVATVRFGAATTTGDAEGETVRTCDVAFARAELASALARFVGPLVQTPPAFAALKFQGRNYYEYARAGIDIPRVPRAIEIGAIELIDWSAPLAVLRVACSKGTYMRVLAEDRNRTDKLPNPKSSILKIKGSEIQQATTQLLLEIAGPLALPYQPEPDDPEFGSNEIQRNILAKAVLGF